MESTPQDSGCQLLPLAREIDAECAIWWPKLRDGGSFDIESLTRMQELRRILVTTTPTTPTDAAIVLGALSTVAAFLHGACTTDGDFDAETAQLLGYSTLELLTGFGSLMAYLEGTGAQSPRALGLFQGHRGLN